MPDNPNNPDTPSSPPTLADKQIDLSPFTLIDLDPEEVRKLPKPKADFPEIARQVLALYPEYQDELRLSEEERAAVRGIGDNTGCMLLKGASGRHQKSERPDEWPMREELLELAEQVAEAMVDQTMVIQTQVAVAEDLQAQLVVMEVMAVLV